LPRLQILEVSHARNVRQARVRSITKSTPIGAFPFDFGLEGAYGLRLTAYGCQNRLRLGVLQLH